MEVESVSTYATEPIKSGLCISPKALDAIDMRFLISEFIVSMLNTKMLFDLFESLIQPQK